MQNHLDKLKSIFKINKQITIFLLGLAIVAVVAGAVYITMLNKTDQTLVETSIKEFFDNIKNNNLNYGESFMNATLSNLGFILMIWLLGISVIGIPVIVFMFFCKAFVLGFSVSSIIFNYKLKGALLSFFYIFPHHIINLYMLIVLLAYSMSLSVTIIDSVTKRKTLDFKIVMSKYLYVLVVTAVIFVITTLLEVFMVPALLKMVLTFIK